MKEKKPEQINNKLDKSQTATVIVVILTAFVTTFTGSALNLSIPAISQEFNASAIIMNWIINGYVLAIAAFSVPFGRLADLTGRKRILVIGILIFSICSGGAGFAWSIQVLLVIRMLQGIGASMIFSTNMAVLISAFPPEKRGKVIGFSVASTYIGLSAGPVLGGVLNHYLGWRSIFILTFIIGVVSFFLAAKKLPRVEAKMENGGWDILGNIVYIIMIIAIMYGLSSFSTESYGKYLIIGGVILFLFFIYHELKVKHPIVEMRLFKSNLAYLFSNLAALLNYGATFAVSYLLSIYLQTIRGFDSQIAGLILISQPVLMAVLSPYAGRLSDRLSPFKLASFGMGLCALGLFSFIFISANYPMALVIANLVVVGIGFAFFSSPNTNAVMACVEKKDYSVASSILATMRSIGHSVSMAIITFIFAMNFGDMTLEQVEPTAMLMAMRVSFIIFTIICGVGIFISLKRK
ncbi:MAG: MFS transporter [Anaerovoracaceae bacterium]